jgi:hypothetical protein
MSAEGEAVAVVPGEEVVSQFEQEVAAQQGEQGGEGAAVADEPAGTPEDAAEAGDGGDGAGGGGVEAALEEMEEQLLTPPLIIAKQKLKVSRSCCDPISFRSS